MTLDDEEGAPVVLVERSVGWGIATLVFFVGSFLGILSARNDVQALPSIASLGILATAVAGAGWATYHSARRSSARARIVPGGLLVTTDRSTTVLAPGTFRKGRVFAVLRGQRVVELQDRRGFMTRLEVGSDEEARAVLAAVGVDRRQGTTRFVVKRTSPRTKAAGIVGGVLFGLAHFFLLFLSPGAILLLWLFAAVVWILLWMTNRTTLTVGLDGIELKPLLGRRLFVPHAQIERVMEMPPPKWQLVSHGFTVTQVGKREIIELDTRGERFRGGIWHVDPVRDAVQRAWSSARGSGAARAVIDQIANEQGSTREWIAKLRALGTGQQRADYRAPALDERALFDVVSDATAEAELRAAAAVALGASPEHAPRLRVVADDIADDRVRRVALAAVQPDGEELLEEELEPLRARMRTR